ncbi:MAG: GNAT family N-acetyltransferase [Defluviitaleaceae bacterium]|nr:GNAT family N-acetyltransferase [Defluviitaleaceae bacterium]
MNDKILLYEELSQNAHPALQTQLYVSVACGSAVIERGCMGLLNVVVDERLRRKGYGTELCVALLSAAKQKQAHIAYLQVEQANAPAIRMYEGLGYKKIYSYWYRVRNV